MELKLTTSYDKRFIKQAWTFEPHPDLGFDVRCTVHQRMVDTEDAGVRTALMSMGWTPPDSKAKILLQDKEDGLWLTMACDGKYAAINLDTIQTARWFVEAYRNG